MGLGRAVVVSMLVNRAASLAVRNDEIPGTARVTQWSETRLGPPMSSAEACAVAWNHSAQSEWREPEPVVFPHAGPGARRLMAAMDGMPYQLYLPVNYQTDPTLPIPVHLDLHSHGERKFTLKNSQGLARLLARNMSTSFDNRSCWCLEGSYDMAYAEQTGAPYYDATATVSTGCPMVDCTFADTFPGVVVMPQCWTGSTNTGWTAKCLEQAKNITKYIIANFNGDADNVIVSGTSEGAVGALEFASTYNTLVSAVIVTDTPPAWTLPTADPNPLEEIPVHVFGDASWAHIAGVDNLVDKLNTRTVGPTKYTRFVAGPAAADPEFSVTEGHSADIAYRCPDTWTWARGQTNTRCGTTCREAWGLPPSDWIPVTR